MGRRDAISAKMQPIDQMSTGVEYLAEPSRTSGARYHSVTTYTQSLCVPDETTEVDSQYNKPRIKLQLKGSITFKSQCAKLSANNTTFKYAVWKVLCSKISQAKTSSSGLKKTRSSGNLK
jgi:hypothetical protein